MICFYCNFSFFLLKDNCLTMLCQLLLYNEVNQLYVYIYPLPLEAPSHTLIPPFWVITEHRAELPVLYSSSPRALCFTHGRLYISMLLSICSILSLPPLCPQVSFVRYYYFANKGSSSQGYGFSSGHVWM